MTREGIRDGDPILAATIMAPIKVPHAGKPSSLVLFVRMHSDVATEYTVRAHPKAAMKTSLRLPEESRPLTEQVPWFTELCNLPTSHNAYWYLIFH